MSLPLLPLLLEAAPLILGALSVGVSIKSLASRFKAEETIVREIESNRQLIIEEYTKYIEARSEVEKDKELEELRLKISQLVKSLEKEKGELISSALFQPSIKGRNSYLKKLLSEAHVSADTVKKQRKSDS